ncbi:uncharacterized protein SPAPADRAFT_140338 [Spathaspora passalidarum NRRL Y-27907]|uniref:Zn(2)-C6 fungal-type domain-containing protein n=1 Tax=Spathaspora passalidarum (strain NRRL Y-27907 / 11-Y1) TaxID=619300 RepID=G3AQP3_SPAPN|nr:uncharacterized protein SPAPADRAFT_140338 [Spathaspora passalidarum NRRL Y-27907]EGW31590.1 hypothetical protein SPAPADRAFT_140338 [Spathaspora passalidarum NRRL Y-27907]
MTEAKKKIKRSRNGCHNCKRLKIKCDELKPSCSYCVKTASKCDYSLKLTWGGRPYKDSTKRRQQHVTPTTAASTPAPLDTVQFVVQSFDPSTHDPQSPQTTTGSISSPHIQEDPNVHFDLHTNDPEKQDNFLTNYEEDIARAELYMPETPSYFARDYQPIRSSQETAVYSIPPQITPLPTLLLEVPFYRDLLHFWVNVASHHLVPAPVKVYQDNPFKMILTQMAMEYPSILTTLLAFSAKLRSVLIDSNDTPEFVIEQLLTRSCTEMLKILRDRTSAISNVALATSLLLSCFEAFNCKDFGKHRTHVIGARQIIKARSALPMSRGPDTGTERDITFFLMRWFVYIDIIGSLSSARNSDNYLLVADDVTSYEPVESVTSLNEIDDHHDPKRAIDHLMGFDVKFLPHLAKITLLIRKTERYLQEAPGSTSIPISIVQEALEVKDAMVGILAQDDDVMLEAHEQMEKDKRKRKNSSTNQTSPPEIVSMIQENTILRYTNRIFCDTGIIHLYRRVLKIPRTSPLVQELVNGIGKLAKDHIESQSPTDVCCIFCFFTAGCETLNQDMRQFFQQRFEKLIAMGNTSAKRGLEIMKRCWETDEDWISAAKQLDLDITLL